MARTPAQQQKLAEARNQLKILKKAGLYKGDLRKAPTRYALSKLKIPEFRAVITGEAVVRAAPSAKIAKTYSGTQKVHGKKVIVAPGTRYVKSRGGFVDVSGATLPKSKIGKKEKHRPGTLAHYRVRVTSQSDETRTKIVFDSTDMDEVHAWLFRYQQFENYDLEVETIWIRT
jgi:hypothetical protein